MDGLIVIPSRSQQFAELVRRIWHAAALCDKALINRNFWIFRSCERQTGA
jgi:hypothetical protein